MKPKTILLIITSINLLNYIDRWLISAVMPAMQEDLKFSNTTAGIIMSAFMLGYFLSSPIFGYLTDRFNRLKLIFGPTVGWSIGTILSGQTTTAASLISSRVLVGVGEAGMVSAGQTVIADLFSSISRHKAIAIFSAAIPVGSALGFIFGGILEHKYGWRSAFFIAGIPGLILSLGLFLFKDPPRGALDEAPAQPQASRGFKEDISTLLKTPFYMASILGYAAFTFTVGGVASWAPKYLVTTQNLPLTEADLWFGGLTVVTGTLGSILGGYGAAYFKKRNPRGDIIFICTVTALSIPFAILGFALDGKFNFFACMTVAEFLLFLAQPPVNVLILESVSPAIRGMATAFSVFVIHLLGDLISPPLVGFVADHFSLKTGVMILPLVLFLSLYCFIICYRIMGKNDISAPEIILETSPLRKPI